MPNTLTWLHISDIHFHPKKEWRDSASRDSLLEYLKEIFKTDESLKPNFIFCTGDIAFGEVKQSSISEQYNQAKDFFNKLLSICGSNGISLSKDRLFVVPGNHDVNRSKINLDAQGTLQLWAKNSDNYAELINQRFNDKTVEFTDSIKRLDEYGDFIKDYLPHLHDDSNRKFYANLVEFDGLKIGIAGFNSAWSCAGEEDDRNIWLAGKWQFNKARESLKGANLKFGLMHHPTDWLNSSDRNLLNSQISTDFDFWLHGHSHNMLVQPYQNHVSISAGAIGAEFSEEFGINISSFDLANAKGFAYLHAKKSDSSGWTIHPVATHAPNGKWNFNLPPKFLSDQTYCPQNNLISTTNNNVERFLKKRFESSLRAFSSLPRVWIDPVISTCSELDSENKNLFEISDLISNPTSTIIKAPPQYGLTCLAHHCIKESYLKNRSHWLYLDAKNLKPFAASIQEATNEQLENHECKINDVKCVVLDSWNLDRKDALKLLNSVSTYFKDIPLICLQQIDNNKFNPINNTQFPREFNSLYLWSLPRDKIRKIISEYNEHKYIGEEDAVINRIVSDLEVLNLHRTALNCLTLIKVSEIDFDESPVNRTEMIKRVLFLLFNVDEIPSYKSKPDLKDCEYVLGYFCEVLIREELQFFTRDKFLLEAQKCCKERLIDLEVQVVFDVLYNNNILVKQGNYFYFKFAYWIYYFAAQRMHHDQNFIGFIFDQMRYTQYPEIIEFYTGTDRRREDALSVLINDIKKNKHEIKLKCGFPDDLNPYKFGSWSTSEDVQKKMQEEIINGVRESNLPTAIKDQFADKNYDRTKPYNQNINNLLIEYSFVKMMQSIKAGARALRNSDYVSPKIKRELLSEILESWEEITKVLLVILPALAQNRHASFDGAGFKLTDDFSDSPQKRVMEILAEIPRNVVSWNQDDLYSHKMGPLLFDQLSSLELSDISRHELVLLLIKQRPRDWHKHVHTYIASKHQNSFYLLDVYNRLQTEYKYCYATPQTLKEIEFLIKLAATKHLTGDKNPGINIIKKVVAQNKDLIPNRNQEE